jgi:hypothetical protein
MPKVSKNLSLDEAAVARGEYYSELHQTNLSRLVSDFLSRLPVGDPARQLSPTVSRLLGIAGGLDTDAADAHRDHLWKKYGRP